MSVKFLEAEDTINDFTKMVLNVVRETAKNSPTAFDPVGVDQVLIGMQQFLLAAKITYLAKIQIEALGEESKGDHV